MVLLTTPPHFSDITAQSHSVTLTVWIQWSLCIICQNIHNRSHSSPTKALHIQTGTIWPTFWKQSLHIPVSFVFLLKLHRFFPRWSNWHQSSIGSDNGLAPKCEKPLSEPKDGLFYWRIYASRGLQRLRPYLCSSIRELNIDKLRQMNTI